MKLLKKGEKPDAKPLRRIHTVELAYFQCVRHVTSISRDGVGELVLLYVYRYTTVLFTYSCNRKTSSRLQNVRFQVTLQQKRHVTTTVTVSTVLRERVLVILYTTSGGLLYTRSIRSTKGYSSVSNKRGPGAELLSGAELLLCAFLKI